jgi:O-antigen ligase
LVATDRLLGAVVVLLLLGTTLAFGGRVWWAAPVGGALCAALVLGSLFRMLLEGSVRVLKSPLALLGLLALLLAAAQLVPMPRVVAERVSPRARAAYQLGILPDRARAVDPDVALPDGPTIRTPVSLDRAATLRWMAGGMVCLAVFWGVARFTDRLGHLYLVWGSVVAAFFLNTAVALVQFACGAKGLYGFIEPGRAPFWAPTLLDLLAGPSTALLRSAATTKAGHPVWAHLVLDRPFLMGSQMGGPGGFLALGSIGMPLALALTFQLIAPRGSRESIAGRYGQSGQGSLVTLLFGMLLASAILVGLVAGPWFSLPFAVGLILVGVPSAWPSGLRWSALGLTSVALAALTCGAALGSLWAESPTSPAPIRPLNVESARQVWSEALAIARDFPIAGTGLGTFSSVFPHYKTADVTPTTALSSVLQWWIESGFIGLSLLTLAGLWCLFRLPGAVRAVGTADRALAFGLIGATVGFTLFSAVHWTVELASVALAASALAGACDRWLAGGTDLFVERGSA